MRSFVMCALLISAAGGAMGGTPQSGTPQSAEWDRLVDQGDAFEHSGHYQEAAAGYEAALRIAEKFESSDARIPLSLNKLATVRADLGRFSDAARLYRRALTFVERTTGKSSAGYGSLLNNLGAMYLEQEQFGKAEPFIREAIAIDTAVLPADDVRLAMARSGLADVLIHKGRYREAEQLLNQAIQAFEKRHAGRDLGIARNNLGVMLREQKRYEESRRLLEDAIAAIESDDGAGHPLLARVLNNLGLTYRSLGRNEEAGQVFRRSIEVAQERLGVEHPMYGVMLFNYARFLQQTGHKAEGKTLEAQSRAVLRENARRDGSGMTVDVTAFRQK